MNGWERENNSSITEEKMIVHSILWFDEFSFKKLKLIRNNFEF